MATTKDLLQQAANAAGAAARELLAAAERATGRATAWLDVAEAWSALRDWTAVERCLAAARRCPEVGIWDHRRIAAIYRTNGDRANAVATLLQLEMGFLGHEACAGLDWRILAEGFAELPDEEGARRCLAAGRDRAANADDLCSVARGYASLVADHATARAVLERAEGLAAAAVDERDRPDVSGWWSVATCWLELFADSVRGRAALEAGLARAGDVPSCLCMARAMPRHFARVRRALAKARAFASDFEGWLNIAETTRECHGRPAAIRSALGEAEALAKTLSERRRLQWVRSRWFGHDAAATSPEVLGPLPDELAPKVSTSWGWQQDAGALFDWLRPQLTEARLRAIAEADYGDDSGEHFAMLQDIVRSGRLPVPLRWEPREALELCQWEQGLAVDHVQRAFCCVVLCMVELAPESGSRGGIECALAVLLESCAMLGPAALVRVEGLLVALLERPAAEAPESAFVALGLLLVAAQQDPLDPRLEALAARLLAIDAELVRGDRYPHPEHGFVLGATHFDLRHEVWQRLVPAWFVDWQVDPAMPALTEVVRRLLRR